LNFFQILIETDLLLAKFFILTKTLFNLSYFFSYIFLQSQLSILKFSLDFIQLLVHFRDFLIHFSCHISSWLRRVYLSYLLFNVLFEIREAFL